MDLNATLAVASTVAGDQALAVEELANEEVEAVLDLTRAVAHAVERKAAPLAAYAIGRALAGLCKEDRLRILAETTARIEAAGGA